MAIKVLDEIRIRESENYEKGAQLIEDGDGKRIRYCYWKNGKIQGLYPSPPKWIIITLFSAMEAKGWLDMNDPTIM